ncbi:MAG: SprT family zinc-dependent metalloprotease [Bacillota bacterium]
MEIRTVQAGEKQIEYSLTSKKVKNINLRIKPSCEVTVSAPYATDTARIDAFVLRNAEFIFKAINKYSAMEKPAPAQRLYVTGESFKIMGSDVALKLYKAEYDKVTFDGEFLHLITKTPHDTRKKQILIEKYFWALSACIFKEMTEKYLPNLQKYGVSYPQIKIRKMKSRWGSCMVNKKIITLNASLIHAPTPCIEYVVLHELCHFVHPNHSKDFYNLVQAFMPDWKSRKRALQAEAVQGM